MEGLADGCGRYGRRLWKVWQTVVEGMADGCGGCEKRGRFFGWIDLKPLVI